MSFRRSRQAALLILGAAVVVFFSKAITLSGALFHFDLIGQNAPIRTFFYQQIAQGNFPLWCPDLGGGFPLFAEGQIGPLYLPNYLFHVFLPPWVAINLTVVFHAFLAIFGAYFYLRNSRSNSASIIGAMVYAFFTYLIFRVTHLMMYQSLCLLPWLYYLFDRFCQKGRIAHVLGAGIVLGLMYTTGHQQGAIVATGGFFIYVLVLSAEASFSGRGKIAAQTLGAGALTGTLALMIAGASIQGIGQLVKHSVRQATADPTWLYGQSLLPETLVRLASPNHHGRWMDNTWWLAGHSELEVAVYLGLAVWILAPLALLGKIGRRDRAHLAVVAFGFLYMLGSAGPFAGLIEHLPVLGRLRIPSRFILAMIPSFAYLVASGLDKLQDENLPPKKLAATLILGAFAWGALAWLGAFAAFGGWVFQGTDPAGSLQALALALLKSDLLLRNLLALLMVVAAIVWVWRRSSRHWAKWIPFAVIGLVVFVDLGSVGKGQNPVGPSSFYGPMETASFIRDRIGPYRVYSLDDHTPYGHGGWAQGTESFRYGIEGLPHSTPLLFGLKTALCPLPLAFARNTRVEKAISTTWLRQLCVKYLLARKQIGLSPVLDTGRVKVFEIPQPAPIYSLARQVVPVDDEQQAYALAGKPAADLVSTAYVENTKQSFEPNAEVVFDGGVEVEDAHPDRRSLATQSNQQAFLVIRESYHPGWRATIDNKPAQIYRANFLHFGLYLPPGEHQVTLTFRPAGFRTLFALGLIGFFGALGLALGCKPLRRDRSALLDSPADPHAAKRIGLAIGILFGALLVLAILRHPDLWSLTGMRYLGK